MKVLKCELCGKIVDDPYFIWGDDKKYCPNCDERINEMRLDIQRKVAKQFHEKYDPIYQNQAQVLELMNWLYTFKGEKFLKLFGQEGVDTLVAACGE